jgi:hypothetical protein
MTSTDTHANLLDPSHPGNVVFWFAAGASLAFVVMWSAVGGEPRRLLRVGTSNPLRPALETELGPLAGTDSVGHDGQLYYAVARDPLGRHGGPAAIDGFDTNGARYRYRRILFPALAGGFGSFSGPATIWGMFWITVAAFGIAAISLAGIAARTGASGSAVLAALVNPGAIIGALLLTGDALALALALAGVALLLHARKMAAGSAFALAALTKETYVLVPIAAALWLWRTERARSAMAMAAGSCAPLLAWEAWLQATMGAARQDSQNFAVIPLAGVVQSMPIWLTERNPVELALLAAALGAMATAGLLLTRGSGHRLLRYLLGPWVVLAVFAGFAVWSKPNNAARAFAILWPIVVLLVSERRGTSSGGETPSARA